MLFFCGFSGPENSMGLMNLWARSFYCCHLCFSSWQLFITSAVALGAVSAKARSSSHPYPTFLGSLPGKGSQPLSSFHCGPGLSHRQVVGHSDSVGPAPCPLPCFMPLSPWTLCTSPPSTLQLSPPTPLPSPELWCISFGVWAVV